MARVVPADTEHVLWWVRYRWVPTNFLSWIVRALLAVPWCRRTRGPHVRLDLGAHLSPYDGARTDEVDESRWGARNHRAQVDDSITMNHPQARLRRVTGCKGHIFHERLSLSRATSTRAR